MSEISLGELVIIILLLIIVWLLFRKKVVVPNLTVAVDKPSYYHADVVKITGNLEEGEEPVKDQPIFIKVTDPGMKVYDLEEVTTDEDGNYEASWVVPDEAPPGTYTVTATGLGVTATTSFTLNQTMIGERQRRRPMRRSA